MENKLPLVFFRCDYSKSLISIDNSKDGLAHDKVDRDRDSFISTILNISTETGLKDKRYKDRPYTIVGFRGYTDENGEISEFSPIILE